MSPVTRATTAGARYLDLQSMARRDGRPTDELLQLYALEGFLDRAAASATASRLVLKGGVLLAAYDVRRPTKDVDLLAQDTNNDIASIVALVADVLNEQRDDGLEFGTPSGEAIREGHHYSGVRVTVPCTLAGSRVSFHVDVNVGDPVSPEPVELEVKRLLGGTIRLRGYPLEMIFAEKLVTALERGGANTRWRDFVDVYRLAAMHPVDADVLTESIAQVAAFRKLPLEPLSKALAGFAVASQKKWAAWRKKQKLDALIPQELEEVFTAVCRFADPVISGAAPGMTWRPGSQTWSSKR